MVPMSSDTKTISIYGAREHNLKNISLDLPRGKLTVITGLSGSGKSSLAFDTLYAEGQRRYVESLSAYARQFLQLMQKPDVDRIEGLSPAISIEQKTTARNPRSTVGTVTEIYDYMRLLWARVGIPYSPATGLPIESKTVSQMADEIMALPEGMRAYLLAPMVQGRKGEHKNVFAELLKQGFQRVKVDGTLYALEDVPALDKKFRHTIEAVIDRVVIRPGLEGRLSDSLETALRLAKGVAILEQPDQKDEKGQPQRLVFSEHFSCPESGFSLPEIEPRLFSFNSPYGACPTCDGLGHTLAFDADLVVPDENLSLEEGALKPWSKKTSSLYHQTLLGLAGHYNFSMDTPWTDLPEQARKAILYGSEKEKIPLVYEDEARRYEVLKTFEGVIPNLERRWRETDSAWMREELGRYQAQAPCTACGGQRLKPEALCVKIRGSHIAEASNLSIEKARIWFQEAQEGLTPQKKTIAERILKEIHERLQFLNDVGLGYLTLARSSGALSGGESQRIRLASQIGAGLTGVLYVLDEPSIGLHQRDNARLLKTLHHLRDLDNTVIVVEHDEEAMLSADHVVDIGPGAGIHGGEVIAEGTAQDIMVREESLTGQYLSGARYIPIPKKRRKPVKKKKILLKGARGHNLKNIDAAFPLGLFIGVTGVSGGGKSTLVIDTLHKAMARRLNGASAVPSPYDKLEGLDHIDKIIEISQAPIGRTPRSNPATYTGAFTPIRDWFAGLPEARARGYKPGRFSFNVKGGRCEACQGDGVVKIEMHFLADVYVTCDVCQGARYNRETLEITFREKSIADVLDMTVEEGVLFFEAIPSVRDKLEALRNVGLGYIKIGQQAPTLSGGEAQRVKLAKELSKRPTGHTFYILDEPTTGLHFEDVRKLLEVLHALVQQGNTVLVIEHNLDVIKTADWLIDLGPEGGDGGGEIVAEGTPEQLSALPQSWTGRFLKPVLEKSATRSLKN